MGDTVIIRAVSTTKAQELQDGHGGTSLAFNVCSAKNDRHPKDVSARFLF